MVGLDESSVGIDGSLLGVGGLLLGVGGSLVGVGDELVGLDGLLVGVGDELVGLDGLLLGVGGLLKLVDRSLVGVGGELVGVDTQLLGVGGLLLRCGGELIGLDGQLLGVDSELVGLDTQLLGVDTQLLGVGGQLVGLDGELVGPGRKIFGPAPRRFRENRPSRTFRDPFHEGELMTAVLPGAVTGTVRRVLQLEGAAVLLVCLVLFGRGDVSWWLFVATILVPDLAMIGYLAGPRTGAALYNAAHWYGWPLLLWVLVPGVPVWVSLVWAAHIGMDRMLGYGLKHPTDFRDTHLGRIGRDG